jgi:hypothetical protein
MSALRQGPPVCQSGLFAVVIRKGGKALLPTGSEIAQAKDQRFNAELLNLGMSCGSILVGWVVIAGTAGAAPITGGTATRARRSATRAKTLGSEICCSAPSTRTRQCSRVHQG